MAGDASYAASKLRDEHKAHHVDGRKNKQGAAHLLKAAPQKLESGFVHPVRHAAASRKRAQETPGVDDVAAAASGNRPSTRGAGVLRAEDDGRPLSSADFRDVVHPFSQPTKKRARRRKSDSPPADDGVPTGAADTRSLAHTVSDIAPRSGIAQPTPSPESGDLFSPDVATRRNNNADASIVSSNDRGTRRLLPEDVLELRPGDKIALVIPMDRKEEGVELKKNRASVKADVIRHVRKNLSTMAGMNAAAAGEHLDMLVTEGHRVQREGRWYSEFSATVTNFAHCNEYRTGSKDVVDTIIHQGGAIAMRFDLCNVHRSAFELKLKELTAVEIWRRRDATEGMSSHIQFSRGRQTIDTLDGELVTQLSMAEGDPQLTYEVLFKYYRAKSGVLSDALTRAKAKAVKAGDKAEEVEFKRWKKVLRTELSNELLGEFCAEADEVWRTAIWDHYRNYHKISDELISEQTYVDWYDEMAKRFPHHAEPMLNIACNDLFFCKSRFDEEVFKQRKKTALMHFFALCRARNPDHMTHWAMVETLAVFGKGINQVSTRSVAGKNFCTTLRYALEKLDGIYEKCRPEIQTILRQDPTASYVLDNYQKIIPKLTQTDNTSAISHRATAALAMRNIVPEPSIGSILRSPSGHWFSITRVRRATPYLLFFSLEAAPGSPNEEMPASERRLVYEADGDGDTLVSEFVYPSESPRWELTEVPGLDAPGPRTYVNQRVPSMLEYRVPENATDAQLLLESRGRHSHHQGAKIHMEARRHQRLTQQSERIETLASYCAHLREDNDTVKRIVQTMERELKGRDESERFDYDATPLEELFAGKEHEVKAATFVDAMRTSSKQVRSARMFQSEMVRRANPEVGIPNDFYYFPLHGGDETTNAGALTALIHAHIDMGLLEIAAGKDEYSFCGEGRLLSIYGDQLTEARLYPLKQYVMKSLTKIGYEGYVDNLVSSMSKQLIQHDYLHETFHMLDAIYQQYWGGFLQPLSVLLGQKRVTGQPLRGGGKIIDSHLYLMTVYQGALRFRCEMFVKHLQKEDVRIAENETPQAFVLRIDGMYEAYCNEAYASQNEQTSMHACFLKKVESYLRCKKAIRVADVLLLECETNDWLGMWKDCGKKNYLAAGLRRIENYYYNTKPWLLECNRRNRLPLMTEGKGHMAFDQVCELLMCWLKRFPSTPFLPSVINKSKHVSLIRRCALELWGKGRQYSSSRLTSNESEVKRIMEVFRASRILDPSNDVVTMDDKTFWGLVNVKKDFEPSDRNKHKETVEMKPHEKKLIEAMAREMDMGGVDEGEFDRLLNGDADGNDEESVNENGDEGAVDCEGTFDEENPRVAEEEEMLCLADDANRDSILRRMGNSAHKTLNKQAMLDSFARAEVTLKDVVADRDKVIAKAKREEEQIQLAVACFVRERSKRRRVLKEQTRKEQEDAEDEVKEWEASYLRDLEEHD